MTTHALRPRLNASAWSQAGIPGILIGLAVIGAGIVFAIKLPEIDAAAAAMAAVVSIVAIWMFASPRYELTLAVVMLYLGLADGYLKLSTGSSFATLGRDVLLYAIVVGALVRAAIRGHSVPRPPLSGWIVAWTAVVLIQLANPLNGTFEHSVSALRPHLEFVPLFFFGYWTMRSKRRLRGFLMILLAIAAVNGVVGFIQWGMTPEQLASWGPGYESKISGGEDVSGRGFVTESGEVRTRPFALGSDMGFGGIVGLLAVPAALALLAMGSARSRIATVVLSSGVILAVATSQARVAVIGAAVAALAFAALSVTSRGAFRAVMALSLAAIVCYASISILTSNASEGAFDRYSDIAPGQAVGTAYEYRRATIAMIPDYIRDFPLGAGIGSVGPAASRDGGGVGSVGLNAESEATFLLVEVGLLGLLVMVAFNLRLIGLAMRRIRRLASSEERFLLAAVAAPLIAIFATWLVGVSTATSPSAPYLWFAAGILSYWLVTKRQEDKEEPEPPGTVLFEPAPRPPGALPAGPAPALPAPAAAAPAPALSPKLGLVSSFQREMRKLRRRARQRAAPSSD